MADRGPDFLYIGTSKAGSTWLFNVLSLHDDVYLASNKGLYCFVRALRQGRGVVPEPLRRRAAGAGQGRSHSYLSSAEAPARIAAVNPRMLRPRCGSRSTGPSPTTST